MKPYRPDKSGYRVTRAGKYSVGQRPTKDAIGRSYTASRSGHELSDDALRLAVRGSLDRLWGFRSWLQPAICPCCGARSGKLQLTVRGHRLAQHHKQEIATRRAKKAAEA